MRVPRPFYSVLRRQLCAHPRASAHPINIKPPRKALSLPLAALPAPVKTHHPHPTALVRPRDARDAQPPFKLHRKPPIRPLQNLKNPIYYEGARIIARAPAATTAAASVEEWTRGATAGATAARRAGSSSPRGRRENVAAAAGCGASATPGPAAVTAATGSRRTPGSARRALGAASRDRPTGTTSGACGLLGKSSARRAAGPRYRTFSGSVLEVGLPAQQFPRRPWAAASASSCAGRPCLGVKQGGSNDGPQVRAPASS